MIMYKNFILSCLEQASDIALNKFGHIDHTVKQDDNNQVLTEADLEIGALLVDRVVEAFPGHNVIDE